ncbi:MULTISPECIES: DUF418 domain-containing protein [Heyndrickxia]|uniref:DUF418 domain-containing protein n=1 Tax=Heyndrickxia sporothermodurans TaxID=46224 RepID=A0A150KMZ3_9BACI|nr:DUF418 domain-containing protein [Heyndrickxia sporothermodurans]KYC97210.1 hypothetical protein B4102_0865 [Heyndrickxia sporothermodurans]MED3651535.1 DUF418 domain-containing protein [Heyndrickxia sporothermodurans]MED3654810.1 DUF418 domain-containing protein [Heyndrickxia sporothermodurans]MED3696991.1 DUF418 domain-containing protein [Heyndrickxia sporothermodurans]MED3780242.1 DUF418 domain-containing protein [Heyndrickxia sporothermodurans]
MENKLYPTQFFERISSLDGLRGFSLLGIFLINMMSYESPILYYNPKEWWQGTDQSLYNWIELFVQASFYPIFAMLFGYGLVLIRNRTIEKGGEFKKIAVKRLFILLIIGIIHAFLIWSGDVLINYAIFGFILIFLLKLSGKSLMIIGLSLFVIPNLFFSLYLMIITLVSSQDMSMYTDIMNLTKSMDIYSSSNYWNITVQRFKDWMLVNGSSNIIFILFSVIPLMMIGAGAAKLKWLQSAQSERKKWLFILIISLPLGLFLKSLPMFVDSNLAFKYIEQSLGGTILSFAYVAIIALFMSYKWTGRLLKPFAAAGRMSLTIYITQSIVGTFIFYGYGLGLYSKLTLGTSMLLAIGIFIIQVVLAEIWFMKFKYGPLEKIWRYFTYGKSV